MSLPREEILSRIRRALKDGEISSEEGAPTGDGPGVGTEREGHGGRRYRRTLDLAPDEVLELFLARVQDYDAFLLRSRSSELPRAIGDRLAARSVQRLVVPSDLPRSWLGAINSRALEVMRDEEVAPLSLDRIASAHGVLTGCALAIAETGTFVLNGGVAQGRRVLSLLPDYHLCVVFRRQVVGTVPEAVEEMERAVKEGPSPLTLVSGPSATSDIELIRVEGVHGPRILDLILVEDE